MDQNVVLASVESGFRKFSRATSRNRWTTLALAVAVGAASAATFVIADQVPTTMPTTGPAVADATSGRSVKAIQKDLQATAVANSAAAQKVKWSDADSRKKASATLIAGENKQLALIDEYAAAESKVKPENVAQMKSEPLAILYLLGDQPAVAAVDAAAATDDKPGISAKIVKIKAEWRALDDGDAAGQNKVADELIALDTAHPDSGDLTILTYSLSHSTDSAAAGKKLAATVTDVMKNDVTKQIAQMEKQQAAQAKMFADAEAKMAANLENKPFVMTGKTVDGKDFSTESMKGKVILVDFWATWCGPCVAGLPEVKETYKKYHDQGFEIVGVSNDISGKKLTDFTAKDEMPWTQLFDADAAKDKKWNPITTGYGIIGIPTMFLIDKKGVLRTVKARENMKEMIPKLLAE